MRRITNLILALFIIGAFIPMLIPQSVSAHTGSGTVGDPYLIYDVNDLQDMQNHLSSYWELANDIDASATSGWNGGAGFVPVSTFTGHFDGNGYGIDGLYINRGGTSKVGLFGQVTGATITNVVLTDFAITGAGAVGGLVGYAYQSNNISYCRVTGEVSGNSNNIGGLIGIIQAFYDWEYTYVTHCFADVTVTGLVFTCSGYGGLIGSCAKAAVVSQSCSYGSVSGGCGVGGFTGSVASGCSVTDCYSRSNVVGVSFGFPYHTQSIGGFAGVTVTTTARCYSTGLVTCNSWAGCIHVGGLMGQATSGCSVSFWDTQTSGWGTSACGTGKSTSQMTTQPTFTDGGWDFNTVWGISPAINDGYPYLLWWYAPVWVIDDIYHVLWFQPNDIIDGTTLPDRQDNQDGLITWGANPAGVSVVLSPFYSDYAPANITLPQDIITPQDMIGPTGQQDRTSEIGTLTGNPFYPLIKAVSDNTSIPVRLCWIIAASIIVLAAMVVTYKYLPHQMIVAIEGGALAAFFYGMGIFPFWVPLIFAVMALAIILGERSPTV